MKISVGGYVFDESDLLELNEENVNAIFDDCLAQGEPLDETMNISFSRDKLVQQLPFHIQRCSAHKEQLRFMLGQIHNFHKTAVKSKITPEGGALRYTGEAWTQSSNILAALYYLAVQASLIYPFMQEDAAKQFTTIPLSHAVVPTLSPADAGFAAWCSEHEIK